SGVTFLAFGNGSPDIFSTFSAMTHDSCSLAGGELIGAANFITSVVAVVVGNWVVKKRKKRLLEPAMIENEFINKPEEFEGERNPDYTNGIISQMSLTLAPPLLPYDDFERPIYQSKHLHHQYGTTRPTKVPINRRPSLLRTIEDISLQEEKEKDNQVQSRYPDTPSIVVNDDPNSVVVDEPEDYPIRWNRWLTRSSLGDFVANITIVKTGRPMMTISACFGSPMLNILLGIGLSGTYVTTKTG
ncbi:2443_t:CDS:2, partial [Scutellospora calospora]